MIIITAFGIIGLALVFGGATILGTGFATREDAQVRNLSIFGGGLLTISGGWFLWLGFLLAFSLNG